MVKTGSDDAALSEFAVEGWSDATAPNRTEGDASDWMDIALLDEAVVAYPEEKAERALADADVDPRMHTTGLLNPALAAWRVAVRDEPVDVDTQSFPEAADDYLESDIESPEYITAQSVAIDPSLLAGRQGTPSSRLGLGVIILIAIGIALAVGARYLPLANPQKLLASKETDELPLPVATPQESNPTQPAAPAAESPTPLSPELEPESRPLAAIPSPAPSSREAAPPPPSQQARREAASPPSVPPRARLPLSPPLSQQIRDQATSPQAERPIAVPPPAREPYLRADGTPLDAPPRGEPSTNDAVAAPRPSASIQGLNPIPTTAPPPAAPAPPPGAATPPVVPSEASPPPATAQPTVRAPEPAPSAPVRPAELSRPSAAIVPERAARERDELEIRRLLDAYRLSYDRLDVPAAASLWPGVDSDALSRAFSTIARQQVDFDQCALNVSGARATARCNGSLQYVRRVGNTSPQSRSLAWDFDLDHSSGRWLISRVRAR